LNIGATCVFVSGACAAELSTHYFINVMLLGHYTHQRCYSTWHWDGWPLV